MGSIYSALDLGQAGRTTQADPAPVQETGDERGSCQRQQRVAAHQVDYERERHRHRADGVGDHQRPGALAIGEPRHREQAGEEADEHRDRVDEYELLLLPGGGEHDRGGDDGVDDHGAHRRVMAVTRPSEDGSSGGWPDGPGRASALSSPGPAWNDEAAAASRSRLLDSWKNANRPWPPSAARARLAIWVSSACGMPTLSFTASAVRPMVSPPTITIVSARVPRPNRARPRSPSWPS